MISCRTRRIDGRTPLGGAHAYNAGVSQGRRPKARVLLPGLRELIDECQCGSPPRLSLDARGGSVSKVVGLKEEMVWCFEGSLRFPMRLSSS